jgi:DNA polymerase-3 subunit delta
MVELLIAQAIDPSMKGFNLDVVHGNAIDGKGIVALASAFPMMAERRVVLVRDFDSTGGKDALLPYLDRPLASTSLVCISSKPDFRLKSFRAMKASGVVVTFNPLYDDKIPAWISQRIDSKGKRATPEACQLLQAYVGRSLREIQNEIDKLFVYVGDKRLIDGDDVNSVVGMTKQFNIFELQRAIGQRNVGRSMEILERMLDAGESPIGMIVMLTRYFQKLWLLQDVRKSGRSSGEIAGLLKVNAIHAQEYLAAASKFTDAELQSCFEALLQADEALKSTSTDQRLVMTLMLFQLLKARHPVYAA